jgi:hypothetical protein
VRAEGGSRRLVGPRISANGGGEVRVGGFVGGLVVGGCRGGRGGGGGGLATERRWHHLGSEAAGSVDGRRPSRRMNHGGRRYEGVGVTHSSYRVTGHTIGGPR